MRLKGVIFDADGTLLESMKFWDKVVYKLLTSLKVTPDKNLTQMLTPLSMAEGAYFIKNRYNLDISVEEIIKEENRIIENFYFNEVTLKNGVSELLQTLQDLNIPMAVASATDANLIEGALKHLNINNYFTTVISCSDVGEGKGSPKVYLAACESLEIKPTEALVVEDSYQALLTANNAGFYTVGVYDETQIGLWNYIEYSAALPLRNGLDTKLILDKFFNDK